jgi:integrase
MTRGPYRTKPTEDSFGDLITRYRRSPRALGWGPATRRKNDKILAEFYAANHRLMVADFRRGDFIALRDSMAATPSEANNWAKVIRGMLDYAVDIEMIPFNPAARVKPLKVPNPDGYRTWREDEIEAFLRHHPKGSLAHLTLTLALYTGAARADLVKLGWPSIRDDRMHFSRGKTGVTVAVPILPPLWEQLMVLPKGKLTFLETRDGRVRSPTALATQMGAWCVKAGLGGKDATGHRLSLHGLRKALGTRLAGSGCTPLEIAAILGHASPRSSEVYTKAYDRERAADAASEKMKGPAAPSKVTRIRRKE